MVVEQTDDCSSFLKTDTQTINDIAKHFHLRTNLRIAPIKICIHQSNANEATYGLTFKLIKVLFKPPLGNQLNITDEESAVNFIDSDSD